MLQSKKIDEAIFNSSNTESTLMVLRVVQTNSITGNDWKIVYMVYIEKWLHLSNKAKSQIF